MNLKEAFRFQNKLQSMMADAQSILGNNGNITKVQNTYHGCGRRRERGDRFSCRRTIVLQIKKSARLILSSKRRHDPFH